MVVKYWSYSIIKVMGLEFLHEVSLPHLPWFLFWFLMDYVTITGRMRECAEYENSISGKTTLMPSVRLICLATKDIYERHL